MIDGLRVWWRHRNDPPQMIPDPVVWTRVIDSQEPVGFMIDGYEREGWRMVPGSLNLMEKPWTVTFQRFDGKYRWRDDSFKGL